MKGKKRMIEKSLEHTMIPTTENVHAQNQVSVRYTTTNGTFLKFKTQKNVSFSQIILENKKH
jgi:hypothetical protein